MAPGRMRNLCIKCASIALDERVFAKKSRENDDQNQALGNEVLSLFTKMSRLLQKFKSDNNLHHSGFIRTIK